MQSSKYQGTASKNNEEIFPTSPILLDFFAVHQEVQERYNEKRSLFLKLKSADVIIDPRLRVYQNQDLNFLMKLNAKANLNQQRLGKTPETLINMKIMHQLENTVIVCPTTALFPWKMAYIQWTGADNVLVMRSSINKETRKKLYKTHKGTIIINYELVKADKELLMQRKIDTMVVDEFHRLRTYKNMKNGPEFAKAIMSLARMTTYRYALTGTPTPKDPTETFAMLHFLYPDIFSSYWKFIEYYFDVTNEIHNYGTRESHKVIGGFKSKEKEQELLQFLEVISIQRKRKDVLTWLTEVPIRKIVIPFDDAVKPLYNELHEYFEISEHGIERVNILGRMIAESQLSVDPRILNIHPENIYNKTKWILDYISDYPEKSIVIVSNFTEYLKLLKNDIPDAKLVVGETTLGKREEYIKSFNNKKTKILLCNQTVIKESIQLHGADTLIITDRSWVEGDNDQLYDRILPTTEQLQSEKDVQDIIVLLTDCFFDTYIDEALIHRKSMTDIINNYASRVVPKVRQHVVEKK